VSDEPPVPPLVMFGDPAAAVCDGDVCVVPSPVGSVTGRAPAVPPSAPPAVPPSAARPVAARPLAVPEAPLA
jgi:hypothetical protein